MTAWVLHVDLDQFLAAVEVRRRPELRGMPVVVGGDGNPKRPRQVVATASYEARAFGIRSGMPLAQALRRCPDAVFLPSDRPAYDAASAEVMATLRTFPATVEVWGWDEAFMGVTAEDPVLFANEVKAKVAADTGLSCAVGVGDTRLLAKTATGFAKPGGVARLTRREWIPSMGAQPVTAIWGIGPRTAARLAELAIVTVEDLARADHERLARVFGPTIGPHLRVLGLGGDESPIVDEPHVARGRSKEETFTTDVADPALVAAHVERLARELTASVVADGRRVTHVAVKVRTATFFTSTKISKLPAPTVDPDQVVATAMKVLARFGELRPVRLLGVRVVLELPEWIAAYTSAVFDADAAAELFRPLAARLDPLRHRHDLQVVSLVVNGARVDVVARSGDDEWRVVFGSNDGITIDWVSVFERPPPFGGVTGGRAVVVNGPSSVGKSTLLAELRAQSKLPWVVFDEPFLGSVKQDYLIWRDRNDVLHRGFVDGIAALARAGNYVATAAGGHPQSMFEAAMVGVPVITVGLHCATDELVKRERKRRDVAGGLAVTSLAVHEGWTYDLTFDTATQHVGDIAAVVLQTVEVTTNCETPPSSCRS